MSDLGCLVDFVKRQQNAETEIKKLKTEIENLKKFGNNAEMKNDGNFVKINRNKLNQIKKDLNEIKSLAIKASNENDMLKKYVNACDKLSENNPRCLHWVLKVGNLKKCIEFFSKVFNMKILRHEEFNEGCDAKCNGDYSRPWSKTMIGYNDEKRNFALELTYNYGIKGYKKGNDLKYIGLYVEGKGVMNAKKMGYNVVCIDNDKKWYDIIGPDNIKYRTKLINKLPEEPFWGIAMNAIDIEKTKHYWCNLLRMNCIKYVKGNYVSVQYQRSSITLEFFKLQNATKIDFAKAQGRIAFTINVKNGPKFMETFMSFTKNCKYGTIHTKPVTLKTPGKADVEVIILTDVNGYEICFVGEVGFDDLCSTKPGDDKIDWDKRQSNGADMDKGKFEQ